MTQALQLNQRFFEFFGTLLLSGYHSLPSKTDYWSNQIDMGISVVAEALSSKRFKRLNQCFILLTTSF